MEKFKPTDEQMKTVDNLLLKWQCLLFLNSWTLTPSYAEDPDKGQEATAADVDADPVYHQASICFYPRFFDNSDSEQERMVVHELVHCVIEPMQIQARRLMDGKLVTDAQLKYHLEYTVTWLANAFFSLERTTDANPTGAA